MLDAGKMATLREVVARGSFSAAGDALTLTQPAVSRQVALLEAQAGTQLVRRTRQGVVPTEAGRILVAHADVVVRHLAAAEAELAELAGLRRGSIRLGSFFTALVILSAQVAALLEERHPELFTQREDVIVDELVDRRTALRRLQAGELDVAIVFEPAGRREPPPPEVELVALFDDPVRAILPAAHPLAAHASVPLRALLREPWIRPHDGPGSQLVEGLLQRTRTRPPVLRAGRGEEPVEAQALVAAGKGVTVGYDLTVVLDAERIAVRRLQGRAPVRHVQAAIMRDDRSPVARAVLDALREVGRRRAQALASATR